MRIYILFGLPGVGKTYVGKIFEKYFDFYFYEGDQELTNEMRYAIKNKFTFTDKMRDDFFQKLIAKIIELKKSHQKLVIAQTFIKEKYRTWLLKEIPDAKFILVKADDKVREKRLQKRINNPLDLEYSRKMCLNFDNPQILHQVIVNNIDGKDTICKQLNNIGI